MSKNIQEVGDVKVEWRQSMQLQENDKYYEELLAYDFCTFLKKIPGTGMLAYKFMSPTEKVILVLSSRNH